MNNSHHVFVNCTCGFVEIRIFVKNAVSLIRHLVESNFVPPVGAQILTIAKIGN